MTRQSNTDASPPRTFDTLGAIDALEAAGFERERAAALSHQLLVAANSTPDTIEEELDALTRTVTDAIRQIRLVSVGFTVLNLVILAAILVALQQT